MKKIFAVVLVLVLLVPTIGLACDCCSNEFIPSQQLKTPHHCCTTFDSVKVNCEIQKQDQLLPVSPQTSYLKIFSASTPISWAQVVTESSSQPLDASPSLLFLKNPLYIVNQVLRF